MGNGCVRVSATVPEGASRGGFLGAGYAPFRRSQPSSFRARDAQGGDAGKGSTSESEACREVKFFETRTNPFLEANAGKSGESPNGNHSDGLSGDACAKSEKLLESNASSYEDGAFFAFTSLGEFQLKLTTVDRSARYPDDPDTELVTVSYDGTNRSDLR